MNPALLTQFASPDPNAAPLSLTQLVALLNTLVSTEFSETDTYMPYVIRNQEPGADQRDLAWIQLDTQGRPIALKTFYNGHWRRIYNGMLGEIRGYNGNPTNDFDTNGLGKIGLTYDGWHLCNGKDGTPDLSDRFLIAAHMNNASVSGYQGGEWVTTEVKTAGEHTGGFREITLNESNTYRPDIPAVRERLWSATGNAPQPHTGDLWGVKSGTDSENDNIAPAIPGNTTPEAINIINPYIALAYIIFVGYESP